MSRISYFQRALEYLAGEVDAPPEGFPVAVTNFLFWGVWWCVLVGAIYVFSGQSSKFIYIDF